MHLLYRLGSSYAEIRGELGETGHGPVVSGREDTEEELIDGFDSLSDFQHILVAFELRRSRNNRVIRVYDVTTSSPTRLSRVLSDLLHKNQ
jgi:hypothetical protein